MNGETAELKDEVVRLARRHGIVTPYTAYLILEDEQRRGVPVAMRHDPRELEQDVRAKDAAKAVYDMTVEESRSERLRGGEVAVANASNLNRLKYSRSLQDSEQQFALDKGGSFGVTGGGVGGGAGGAAAGRWAGEGVPALKPASSEPADALSLGTTSNGSLAIRDAKSQAAQQTGLKAEVTGYRSNTNYAQQAQVVRGRAFYQNGEIWTDATASAKTDLKKREVKFNSDEYFALLSEHPDAAAWLALGNQVDIVLDDTLVSVR